MRHRVKNVLRAMFRFFITIGIIAVVVLQVVAWGWVAQWFWTGDFYIVLNGPTLFWGMMISLSNFIFLMDDMEAPFPMAESPLWLLFAPSYALFFVAIVVGLLSWFTSVLVLAVLQKIIYGEARALERL